MYYLALACDYDGTLAKDGVVSSKTIDALQRVRASGRKLLLVTGRLLEDVQQVFPRLDLFTYVVAENGVLLYHPASSTEQLLGEAPPRQLLQALQERGVTPLVTGRIIVATLHPYETTAEDKGDWARTSHCPYYGRASPAGASQHSRGDGLSSPSFGGRFISTCWAH